MIRATQTTILRVCEREATTYLVLLVPSHLNITIDGPEETLLPVGEGKRSAHGAVYSQQEPLYLLMGALVRWMPELSCREGDVPSFAPRAGRHSFHSRMGVDVVAGAVMLVGPTRESRTYGLVECRSRRRICR